MPCIVNGYIPDRLNAETAFATVATERDTFLYTPENVWRVFHQGARFAISSPHVSKLVLEKITLHHMVV